MNEDQKYEIIKNLVDNNGNKDRAALTLGCTRRTIDRKISTYEKEGKAGFRQPRNPKITYNIECAAHIEF